MRWDWATADDNALSVALRGCYLGEPTRGPLRGGRSEAVAKLRNYNPTKYGSQRNWLEESAKLPSQNLATFPLGIRQQT